MLVISPYIEWYMIKLLQLQITNLSIINDLPLDSLVALPGIVRFFVGQELTH